MTDLNPLAAAEAAQREYERVIALVGDNTDPLAIIAKDRFKAAMAALYKHEGAEVGDRWKTHSELSVEIEKLTKEIDTIRGDNLLGHVAFVKTFNDGSELSKQGPALLEACMCTYLDGYCGEAPADSGIVAFLQLFRPHLGYIAKAYAGVTKEN